MISLIIPPKDQVSRINKMLADEYGTASNIKSRVNRFSFSLRNYAILNIGVSQTFSPWSNHINSTEIKALYKGTG